MIRGATLRAEHEPPPEPIPPITPDPQPPGPEPTPPPIEKEQGPQVPIKLPGNPGAPERVGPGAARRLVVSAAEPQLRVTRFR